MHYVGRTWRPVSETEWVDLEDRIERELRPQMPPQLLDDRTMMGTQPALDLVFEWTREYKLLDEDDPMRRGSGGDRIIREDAS